LEKDAEEDQEEVAETKMPRPCKRRRIQGNPNSHFFKPAGIRKSELTCLTLKLPEFESIRLIDLENIPQEEASKKMEISQPTLSRILQSARKKIADAIVNGKSIKIENK